MSRFQPNQSRVAALTGIRGLAALCVLGTHSCYTTGKYTHGYWGLMGSRLEIGVPIFFVLSGFLLFRPWVRACQTRGPLPSIRRYTIHRLRRVMPAYIVTVLLAYGIYHFRVAGPNPGHSWIGLIRNLTLTQIYVKHYLAGYLHQGLTQMWSLSVEVTFYCVLPLLGIILINLICHHQWHPYRILIALGIFSLISPIWLIIVHEPWGLPDSARVWLPGYLIWFLAGMMLTVLQALNCPCYGVIAIPLALICYVIVSTPIAGEPTTSPRQISEAIIKALFYTVIAGLLVGPAALGPPGWYSAFLSLRPMVWIGEISYEIFLLHLISMEIVMVNIMHQRVYTGSAFILFITTLVVTIPPAWILHYYTYPQSQRKKFLPRSVLSS